MQIFLSSLTLPIGEEGMVDDQLLDKHLFTILVLSPWLADIEKYFGSIEFPQIFSSKEKRRCIRKIASFS